MPVTANCPGGSFVVGGGGRGFNKDVSISATYPADVTTWKVHATNNGTAPEGVQAYVLCIATEPATFLEPARKGR